MSLTPAQDAAKKMYQEIPVEIQEHMSLRNELGLETRLAFEVVKAFNLSLSKEVDEGAHLVNIMKALPVIVASLIGSAFNTAKVSPEEHSELIGALFAAAREISMKPSDLSYRSEQFSIPDQTRQ